MATLPTVGGSSGTWGTELNAYLDVSHNIDGTLKNRGFNVKDYGAVGDYDTNDTAAIQAAIDAAAVLTTSGGVPQQYSGVVYFPPGAYSTGQLTLKSRVRLVGAAPAAGQGYREAPVRLFPTGIADDGYLFIQSGAIRNVAIEGIASYHQGGGSSSKIGFANFTDVTDGIFSGLHIDNYGLEAMVLAGTNCRVSNSYMRGVMNTTYIAAERGAFTLSGADHQISHCEFTGASNSAISSASLFCIAAKFSMNETVVSECVFQIGDVGLDITGGSRNRYVGCRFDSNAAHGLVLSSGTYMAFAGCVWSRNSFATSNTYDHINVVSGGGSLASFQSPMFNNNSKTIRYWINDAKDSASFHNVYHAPHGEAAGTANWNLSAGTNPSIITGVEPTTGRVAARPLWTSSTYGLRRTSALAETFSRVGSSVTNVAALTSGRMNLVAIWLTEGQVINQIGFFSATTALVGGSNQWFGLWSSARSQLRLTADDTTTAWAANTEKVLTLSSSYTVLNDGLFYLSIMVNAGTVPTVLGLTSTANMTIATPILTGFDGTNTGLTNPASAPATAAAFSSTGSYPWAYVK